MRATLPSGTPVEIARPDVETEMGLVIAPDIFGLRPLYDDMVARLARDWGVVAVAVEPFPGMDLGPDVEPRFAAVPTKTDERALADLVAGADLTGGATVGLIGFCMGGMYAFKAASLGRFHRIASFYGMIKVPAAWQGSGHGEPLELLAAPGASPVLAILGGQDHYTPPEDIAELKELANVTCVEYPDAEHGFAHDANRPAHRPADAADAWRRAREWLVSASGS
ncbi:MAG TPA: dienelactone hydrolase family protein [Acidimicrobiales bacterium]